MIVPTLPFVLGSGESCIIIDGEEAVVDKLPAAEMEAVDDEGQGKPLAALLTPIKPPAVAIWSKMRDLI
jgi:hypothetical protein